MGITSKALTLKLRSVAVIYSNCKAPHQTKLLMDSTIHFIVIHPSNNTSVLIIFVSDNIKYFPDLKLGIL